jgi:hypothetical protein
MGKTMLSKYIEINCLKQNTVQFHILNTEESIAADVTSLEIKSLHAKIHFSEFYTSKKPSVR